MFVASRLYVLWRGLWGLSMIFMGVGQSYMYDGLGGLLSNSRKPRVMNKHQIVSLDVVVTLCDNPIMEKSCPATCSIRFCLGPPWTLSILEIAVLQYLR